jgi:23S rRNA (cytidine1920-2'-O)/16S rRNA (cytidine1409-2'-O)-methyltransferase
VLLAARRRSVVALDVGHGQLDWRLRRDPRVVVLERTNARTLTSDRLPEGHRDFDVVTIDVSFISLRLVLPPLVPRLRRAPTSWCS